MRWFVFLTWMSAVAVTGASARGAVLHVDANSVSPAAPYDTWANAAGTIQDALNAASDGDTVNVTNGTYSTGGALAQGVLNRAVITNAVTLRSTGGPDQTVVDGGGSNRVVFLNHPDARVIGFTLRNGWTRYTSRPGAGIWASGGTVSNCYVLNCHSTNSFAGGLYAENGIELYDCLIASNSAQSSWTSGGQGNGGGIVFAEYSTSRVERCEIRHNVATRSGGGVYSEGRVDMDESIIALNRADDNGGGFAQGYSRDGYLTARNSLFYGNFTKADGGGFDAQDEDRLDNCTIADNTALGKGGGLLMDDTFLRNSIVYGNRASVGDDWYKSGFDAGYATNCILQPTHDIITDNVIPGDPIFTDADNHDYRPSYGSPAIDNGFNTGWTAGGSDLAGQPRRVNGTVDIGAYEYQPAMLAVSFSNLTDRTGSDPLQVTFQAAAGGSNTTGVTYSWDFDGDGSNELAGTTYTTVTNLYSSPGLFDVRVQASNAAGHTAEQTRSDFVKAAASHLYVSPSGSHTSPFTSQITAATNLLDAVALGWHGSTVEVDAGTYSLHGTVRLEEGIHLLGPASGAPAVLDGRDLFRVLSLTHSNALAENLTLQRGYVEDLDGAGAYLSDGELRNCRLVWNNTYRYGLTEQGGGAYLDDGGTLTDCVVASNSAGQGGGVYIAGGGTVYNSLISSNKARNSGSAGGGIYIRDGGTVLESTVQRNRGNSSTGERGAGIYLKGYGTLINVLSVSNIGTGVYNEYDTSADTLYQNCTIAYNTQYGLYSGSGGDGLVRNCIIYHNGSANAVNLDALTVTHTCISPAAGTAAVAGPPDFGPGLHLLSSSPCIDAGSSGAAPAADRDGLMRPLDGNGDSIAAWDVGAYERADRNLELAGNGLIVTNGDATPRLADGTDFGGTAQGGLALQTFTLTNRGTHAAQLTANPAVRISGPQAADFTVTHPPAVPLPGTNGSTSFTIEFAPQGGGARTAEVQIVNNDWDRSPYTFTVRGDGENAPVFRLTGAGQTLTNGAAPARQENDTDFGVVQAARDSITNSFRIWNDGTIDMTVSNIHISPTNAFSVSSATSATVPSGTSMVLQIAFKPQMAGCHQATATVTHSDAANNPFTFEVAGRAGGDVDLQVMGNGFFIAPGDTTPARSNNTDAGQVALGDDALLSLVLTNAGPDALHLQGPSPVTLNPSDGPFRIDSAPATNIAAGSGTDLRIRFEPLVAGVHTAQVAIVSDDADRTPYVFHIAGTGGGTPDLHITGRGRNIDDNDTSPAIQDGTYFGAAAAGQVAEHAFLLENTGSDVLTISNVQITGAAHFTVVNRPDSVTHGTASNLLIRFSGSAAGYTNATVTVISNDPETPNYTFRVAGLSVVSNAPDTFYVNAGNLHARPPYTNWFTAASEIEAAVAVASGPADILVSNTTYTLSETVLLTEPVHLKGWGGQPTVDAATASTSVESRNSHAGISGFHFRNGSYRGLDLVSIGRVSNCTFSGFGSVTQQADSVIRLYTNGLVSDVLIHSNYTATGVYMEQGGTLQRAQLIDNITDAGALHISQTGTADRCEIRGNTALFTHDRGGGGGVYIDNGGLVKNSRIGFNSGLGGGGVHMNYGGILENCLIDSNAGGHYDSAYLTNFIAGGRGGGVFIEAEGTLRHCTVTENSAELGGGLHRYTDGGTVINSIIANNTADSGSNWYHVSGGGTTLYTLTAPALSGAGNSAQPPGFKADGSFELAWNSAAVDAGTHSTVTTDLNGIMRPADGNQDGTATADMGAFEFEPSILLSTNTLTVPENETAGISIRLASRPDHPATVTVVRVSGDTDLSVSAGATLTFTTGNWSQVQTALIAAADDIDRLDGSAVFHGRLDGAAQAAFTAIEADDDTGGAVTRRWLFDLGADSYTTTGHWNNVTDEGTGIQVANAVTANGVSTDVDFNIIAGFSGINSSGLDTNTLYPATAQRDSFYLTGPGDITVMGLTGNQAEIRLQGLRSTHRYDIRLFASRSAAGDYNRSGRYTVGAETNYMNAADNITNRVVFTGMSAADGQIDILVEPYDSSGAGQSYSYVGVLELIERDPAGSGDQDGDGMPDDWENLHGGGVTNLMPEADEDGDGMSNLQEYIAGTEPTNAVSHFRISALRPVAGEARYILDWNTASGRVYSVYWSSNLLSESGFRLLHSNLPAAPPVNTWTDTVHSADEKGFYRIDVQLQTP